MKQSEIVLKVSFKKLMKHKMKDYNKGDFYYVFSVWRSGAMVARKKRGKYGLTKNILFILTQSFHSFCGESQDDT